MKKIILVLLFLIFISAKLCSKPVGLANCGNTCFQNGFIQMLYQIDPVIDILSTQQNLFPSNTLGYTFQHLVWDIIDAQKTNKSVIGCGSTQNPTNLKKFTEGVYSCMNLGVGRQGDLGSAFNAFSHELKKASDINLVSILTVLKETIVNPPGGQPYIYEPSSEGLFLVTMSLDGFENDVRNLFNEKMGPWKDPNTGINYQTVDVTSKLLSAPKFMIFRYSESLYPKGDYFPDQVNFDEYIKGNTQALYQLRAIGLSTPGHWVAVVRDKDGKLYLCNDSSVQQVNTWQEGIGTYKPLICLYVLKTTTATTTIIPPTNTPQDSSDSKVLAIALNKLQQSLKNLEFMLKKQTEPLSPPRAKPETSVKPKITTYEELKKVMERAYEYDTQKKFTAKNPDLLNDYEQTTAVTTAKYLAQELLEKGYNTEDPHYVPFIAYVTQQVAEQYPDKTINLHCVSLAAGKLDKELLLIRALRFVGYNTIALIAIDIMYNRQQQRRLKVQFNTWCKNYNITVSFDPKTFIQNGVNAELFQDTYQYMQQVITGELPKNHLFLMIQPGSGSPVVNVNKLNLMIKNEQEITPNYLDLEDNQKPDQNIKIYLPYKKSDFFITATGQQDTIIKNIKEEIQKWTGTTFSPQPNVIFTFTFYQQALMLKLINNFFIQKKETIGGFTSNVFLCFCELIKYTALKPTEPLAFETLNLTMRQITDTSGSLEQMYKRYYYREKN